MLMSCCFRRLNRERCGKLSMYSVYCTPQHVQRLFNVGTETHTDVKLTSYICILCNL